MHVQLLVQSSRLLHGLGVQINPCTVLGMVREANVPKGGWFLQNAATSVLGRQVSQLCSAPQLCLF